MQAHGGKKDKISWMTATRQPRLLVFARTTLKQGNHSHSESSSRHRPCSALSKASSNPSPQGCATAADNVKPQLERHRGFCPRKHSSITIPGKMPHYLLAAFSLIHKLLKHSATKIKVILSLVSLLLHHGASQTLALYLVLYNQILHTCTYHARNIIIIIKAKLPNLMWR